MKKIANTDLIQDYKEICYFVNRETGREYYSPFIGDVDTTISPSDLCIGLHPDGYIVRRIKVGYNQYRDFVISSPLNREKEVRIQDVFSIYKLTTEEEMSRAKLMVCL